MTLRMIIKTLEFKASFVLWSGVDKYMLKHVHLFLCQSVNPPVVIQ